MRKVSEVGRKLVEDTFKQQKLLINLGCQVEIALPVSNVMLQQHGFVHGGVISTVADVAAGLAAYSLLTNPTHSLITIEMKINFIKPVNHHQFFGVGKVIKENKSMLVNIAEIYTENKLCAYMLQTVSKVTPQQSTFQVKL